ncbi:MAG: glycosyltransferase [Lentisphaeria bacterium]
MPAPKISVIVPCYNAGGLIGDALASIRRQNYAPLEIIVIDDGSTDDSAERIKRLGDDILFLRQDNRGPAAARNAGLKRATGDYIAFLDADDLWPEGKLTAQAARLERQPELAMVTGRIQYVRLEGAPEPAARFEDGDTVTSVYLGALLARRVLFDQVGLFDEKLRFSEDHDWYLRVRESGAGIGVQPEVTLIYRRHAGNMTRGKTLRDFDMVRVLKQSLARRKAVHGVAADLPSLKGSRDA